jgi:hypothetical protein
MNNFEFPPQNEEKKPQVAYTEMKIKCLITDVEKRVDKFQKDY